METGKVLIEGKKYSDFRENPSKILEKGRDEELILIKGIGRSNSYLKHETFGDSMYSFLEIDENLFISLEGSMIGDYGGKRVPYRYLQASCESNNPVEITGKYCKNETLIQINSVKLGNLERRFLKTNKLDK